MGTTRCDTGHDYLNMGIGLSRRECRRCGAVMVDVDAAKDGSPAVTAPGLFGPSRPTIFTVLAEERRKAEAEAAQRLQSGPRFGPKGQRRLSVR